MVSDGLPGAKARVLDVDTRQPYAGMQVIVAMSWPGDQDRQKKALAAFAMHMLGKMDDLGASLAATTVESDIAEACRTVGFPLEAALVDPVIRAEMEQEMSRLVGQWDASLTEHVLRPAGGRTAAANAPEYAVLMEELRTTWQTKGRVVGRAMCILAAMDTLHPDLDASLNRVWAIMDAHLAGDRDEVPSDRSPFMKAWHEMKNLAPLYAAYALYLGVTVERGAPANVGAAAFGTPDGLAILLGWAQWFRDWAVQFRPQRSRDTLLRDDEATVYRARVEARRPPLEPLHPDQVEAARLYRAPTGKFNA